MGEYKIAIGGRPDSSAVVEFDSGCMGYTPRARVLKDKPNR
jgi:hypothetical protein